MLHFVQTYTWVSTKLPGCSPRITNVIHGIHGTLISTLFVLNIKEKPKVDPHCQYPLQDSGTMYPYLLEKWIL